MARAITLSGELRWFLSCLPVDEAVTVQAKMVPALDCFWSYLRSMARVLERGVAREPNLSAALGALADNFSGRGFRNEDMAFKAGDLPMWRAMFGNMVAVAIELESANGGRVTFLDWREIGLPPAVELESEPTLQEAADAEA